MTLSNSTKYVICGLAFIAVITVIVITLLLSFKSSKSQKDTNEPYFYDELDKQTVISILSKPCKITLRDYTNILNSTENLKTIYLQQICNNYVCANIDIKNEDDLFSFIKAVAGECILKCIKDNDLYRLALVNLKINDILASRIPSYVIFKRALTKGVYGVEYVNIYIGNEQVSVKDVVETTLTNINPLSDQQITETVKEKNFDEKEKDLFETYIKDFINKVQNSTYLKENKDNESKDFPIELFCLVSSTNIYRVFTVKSMKC